MNCQLKTGGELKKPVKVERRRYNECEQIGMILREGKQSERHKEIRVSQRRKHHTKYEEVSKRETEQKPQTKMPRSCRLKKKQV